MLGLRIANDRSALIDELKLRQDNSDVIETVSSFLTATVLFT